MTGTYDLVTVVFESEVPLLELQARSVDRYVPPELLGEIVIIDNSARGMPRARLGRIQNEYGAFASHVRVLRPPDICEVPATVGWHKQQVLKLAVARLLGGGRYVVLDAKNHFVAPLELSFLEAPDGRPRVNAYSYETHPLRPGLERVLTYVGLDPAAFVGWFTATVTPFVLDTELVVSMMDDIASRSGRPFAEEFVAQDLLEFFLYSGWIVSQGTGLTEHYDLHQVFCPNVWPKGATTEAIRAAVESADSGGAPIFSVHRKALAAIDEDALDALASFWTRRGLFDRNEEALEFVADFRRVYAAGERRRKLRELPQTLPRRIAAALGRQP